MRKQTEQQILKNKIAGYGYIDKRDCQKAVSFGFMASVWVKEVISALVLAHKNIVIAKYMYSS